MLVTPKLIVRGEYRGQRDQKYTIRFNSRETFCGDVVKSLIDPELVTWDVSNHFIGDSLWYDTGDLKLEEGDTLRVFCELSWTENFAPDTEFAYAPGDGKEEGDIALYTVYERTGPNTIEIFEDPPGVQWTNIHCAHELAHGLYISFTAGTYDENLDYSVVGEVFDGYHIWRKVDGGNDGWLSIWEMERNTERHKGYWWWVDGHFNLNTPPNYGYDMETLTPIFGDTRERLFLDFDVHNGFSYQYAVTSFDRGFRPNTGDNDHIITESIAAAELPAMGRPFSFNRQPGTTLLKSIYAVPNPLRTGRSAFEDPTYHNYPDNVVRFVGLTPGSQLKVYNLTGDLVLEKGPSDMEGANIIWDTRNQSGEFVASGVYIFRATNPEGEEEYGRLAIIR